MIRVIPFSFLLLVLAIPVYGQTQTLTYDADVLVPRVAITLSPRDGTFIQNSLLEVPIVLDTRGQAVNGVELYISFDPAKLSIVKPSGGTSIIGMWVEPPSYDNVRGTARYIGLIPNGITTSSGIVGTITFQAKNAGTASVRISEISKVFLNDGLGTQARIETGRAEYAVVPRPPEGVRVFSETHPSPSTWYNNRNPVLAWERDPDVTAYSYEIDTKPGTVPDNVADTDGTVKAYEDLGDALWYFHIKAQKSGIWGTTGHYPVRIDTTPPAEFVAESSFLMATPAIIERALVSFFTTDTLSGVSHYEVGVIDKRQPTTVSPIFIRAESPFQLPATDDMNLRVVVRAVDYAGNVRDAEVDVAYPRQFITQYRAYIPYLLAVLFLILVVWVVVRRRTHVAPSMLPH